MNTIYSIQFYENPIILLDALNLLNKSNLLLEKDFYSSGKYLFIKVANNAKSAEIFSKFMNVGEYLSSYKASHDGFDDIGFGLCALFDEYGKHFDLENEILWNRISEEFVFAGMLNSEEY